MMEKDHLRKLCDDFKAEHRVKSLVLLVKRKEMKDLDKLCSEWDDVDVLPLSPKTEDQYEDGQIHFCHPPIPEPLHPEDMPREDLLVRVMVDRLRCLKSEKVLNTGEIRLHSEPLIPESNLEKLAVYFRELFDLTDDQLVEESQRYEGLTPSPS